jgi:WD40 repeat protein
VEVNAMMWDKAGVAFFVADMQGNISLYDGKTIKTPEMDSKNEIKNPMPVFTLGGIHKKLRCETLAMHPSNEFLVSGGNDSIIAFWDFDDLLCTGTISDTSN